jgi:hypothetical protein
MSTRSFSRSQRIMIVDTAPAALFLTSEQRAEGWRINPPRPMPILASRTAQDDALRASLEQQLKEEIARPRKSIRPVIDRTGQRWDSVRNRWVPDITPIFNPRSNVMKWKITPYGKNGDAIVNGIVSIEPGTPQVEIFATMGEVFHSFGAGEVTKIVVTDAADGIIREWDNDGSELPKPSVNPGAGAAPKSARNKKITADPNALLPGGAARSNVVKNDKPKTPRVGGPGSKGVGVIATIVEAFSRDKGANIDEIVEILVKKFPDREVKGMTSTARIQVKRQGAIMVPDDKRGKVYYRHPPGQPTTVKKSDAAPKSKKGKK